MSIPVYSVPKGKLARLGLRVSDNLRYQLSPEELVLDTLRRGEGTLSDKGALVIKTGEFTGRSPKDRFIVKDPHTATYIDWNEFNLPLEEKYFEIVLGKMTGYLNRQPKIWVRDCFACADPRYRLPIRIINETPAINLFAYNMFLRPTEEELESFKADWHVLSAPGLRLNASECGTRRHNAVIISFKHKIILLAGT
ncbi:MAG TPA: phosphoenolpyruvate carboxykinase (ATP), partial [Puia sp.]|nr:phosphoenolpyruvate carboxykinase (ATP) [Puia sp.]